MAQAVDLFGLSLISTLFSESPLAVQLPALDPLSLLLATKAFRSLKASLSPFGESTFQPQQPTQRKSSLSYHNPADHDLFYAQGMAREARQ